MTILIKTGGGFSHEDSREQTTWYAQLSTVSRIKSSVQQDSQIHLGTLIWKESSVLVTAFKKGENWHIIMNTNNGNGFL